VVLITNSTKIINSARTIHTLGSFCLECIEDSTNLEWTPIDVLLFGQCIPLGLKDRNNFFVNATDLLGD
jgi:hypothetical protein